MKARDRNAQQGHGKYFFQKGPIYRKEAFKYWETQVSEKIHFIRLNFKKKIGLKISFWPNVELKKKKKKKKIK